MAPHHEAHNEADWVDAGLVKADELEAAEEDASARALTVAEVLVERGSVDERRLFQRIAETCGLELWDADRLFAKIDPRVAGSVPRPYQERKRLLPLARVDRVLLVASCDPTARTVDLTDALDCDSAELRLTTPTDLRRLRWAVDLGQLAGHARPAERRTSIDLLSHDPDLESRHAALLDAILIDAVGDRASDVHMERYGDRVRLRMRVDGDLHDVQHYALSVSEVLGTLNVLKIRAGLDIAERRLPQGGRFTEWIGGREFDLRVQTLPSLHGEGAVVRLLPQDRALFTIDSLGFSEALAARYRTTLRSPAGLLLVVGPTGSGKSTTLYTGLQLLARAATRKVITVEDPIEYAIPNVHQTQVHSAIGYTFANSVRSFVRHDPDVIFVGEIRDEETALEALRASQTGHLVLSTLHAADSVDAVQRLFDLGMHPNSIAAELLAVFAQRLVKRICPNCREEEAPDPELTAIVFPNGVPADFRAYRGGGCAHCGQRGSYGRIAVAEHLPSTRDLRIAISHHRPLDEIRAAATQAGLRPMREHALELAAAGTIRFNDLPEAIPLERLAGM